MANFKQEFEKILKQKLSQKSTVHTSEETLLIRYFKYFDLNNSGAVSKSEWLRAVEKMGIVMDETSELESLFDSYDLDQSGSLDYKEFSSSLFGEESRISRQMQIKPSTLPVYQQRADDLLDVIRDKLRSRGLSGLLNFFRSFWAVDGPISSSVFSKVFKDFRLNISDSDSDFLFSFMDEEAQGLVPVDRFLKQIKSDLPVNRKEVAIKAYEKVTQELNEVTVSAVTQLYSAVGHPDIKLGKRTQEEVLNEFISTFESHHAVFTRATGQVSPAEWLSYYSFVSFTIENDIYFDQLLNSTWRLYEPPQPLQLVKPDRIASIGVDLSAPMEKLRTRLASRGARGLLGLAKQFQIMDDDGSRTLSYSEFCKACRDFRIDLSESETREIFTDIDRDRSGFIDYDELLRAVRGPLSSFRRKLVDLAWNRLDRDQNGVIDIDDLRGVYSASKHPDVKSGRKTEDAVLNEFLDTFEIHHNMSSNLTGDRKVTKEEFLEYYSNVASSIEDDAYFEVMMNNAWRLQEPHKPVAWAGSFSSSSYNPNHKVQWLADHHRSQFGGSVAENAPFGTSSEPIDYSTHLRPRPAEFSLQSENVPPAGTSTWSGSKLERLRNSVLKPSELFEKFKSKLLSRGTRGLLGLARLFKNIDDNGNKMIEFAEFCKVIHEFRIDFSEDETAKLFKYFDADSTGGIDYEEFIHRVRGQLNESRKALVCAAFRKLDRTGDGVVGLEDLRGVYNASLHPEVRLGRKSEDEVLCEFLDTFEVHHALFNEGQGKRDAVVTLDEFLEYYKHVSASIDDDRYFDLMMRNAWNFENRSNQKAWKAEV